MTTEDMLKAHNARTEARMTEMRKLFAEIQDFVRFQIDQHGELTAADGKKVATKLGELQTLQLSLLRAEESFLDKLDTNPAGGRTDYDQIRRDIGRALNRIRAADPAEGVPRFTRRASD